MHVDSDPPQVTLELVGPKVLSQGSGAMSSPHAGIKSGSGHSSTLAIAHKKRLMTLYAASLTPLSATPKSLILVLNGSTNVLYHLNSEGTL
jgi:hypothetical protein